MNNEKQVDELIKSMKAYGIPLSDAAWETALACVGWTYVFGAWGEECTPANRKRRARDDHKTIVTKCQVLSGKKSGCDGCKWYPDGERVRMFDCRGFTDWVLKQYGIDLTGEGATSQWNTDSNWAAKGEIGSVPENVLVCLFVKKGSKMEHTGFGYEGATCECSSGVQYTMKRAKKWTHWAIPAGITDDVPKTHPTLRKGDKGPDVVEMQEKLLKCGEELPKYGADGSFGKETQKAVKSFQKKNGLKVDGICGKNTWAKLDELTEGGE